VTTESDPGDRRARDVALLIAGALGPSIAHELRNVLAAAESAIFLAKRDAANRARLDDHLARAESEVQKAQAVIERVLGLARGEPLCVEAAPVGEIIASARAELDDLPEQVDVLVSPPDLEASCDPVLVERVLVNLLSNARDAVCGAGRIAVRAHRQSDDVMIEVEDDGPGIDPSIASRLFEPRVTTKSTGTGLGLAVCRAIAIAHGGTIEALVAPSGGALFRITLPSA